MHFALLQLLFSLEADRQPVEQSRNRRRRSQIVVSWLASPSNRLSGISATIRCRTDVMLYGIGGGEDRSA